MPQARVPLDWAEAQNRLGATLAALGRGKDGAARLEEAVLAYRKALRELNPDRVPLEWAMTQTNLGAALLKIGEHKSDNARLNEAVVALRAA